VAQAPALAGGAVAHPRLQAGDTMQEYTPKHVLGSYEAELDRLRQLARQMGELAGRQIEAASAALAA